MFISIRSTVLAKLNLGLLVVLFTCKCVASESNYKENAAASRSMTIVVITPQVSESARFQRLGDLLKFLSEDRTNAGAVIATYATQKSIIAFLKPEFAGDVIMRLQRLPFSVGFDLGLNPRDNTGNRDAHFVSELAAADNDGARIKVITNWTAYLIEIGLTSNHPKVVRLRELMQEFQGKEK